MDVHVNREKEAAEKLLGAVIYGELESVRNHLRRNKLHHAMFLKDGLAGVKHRMRGAVRKAAAMCDNRLDTPSMRLGMDDSASLFWAACSYDWYMLYTENLGTDFEITEDPRAFLDSYEPPSAFTPATPDEKVNLDFFFKQASNEENNGQAITETEEQRMMRRFGTTRLQLEGVTPRELGAMEVAAAHAPGAKDGD